MKKKSKFLTFMLSFIPGLGHIYLGFHMRGAGFLAATIAVPTFVIFIQNMLRWWFINDQILIVLPFIWLFAMVDSMVLADRINTAVTAGFNGTLNDISMPDYGIAAKQNKKIIAMFLSIIPGAGHLYLGLQKQGVELMAGFFLSFYLTDLLKLSIFMLFAPIIWFLSIFDVMHKVSGDRAMSDDRIFSDKWFRNDSTLISEKSVLRSKHKMLGYALILIGAATAANKIIYPFIGRYISGQLMENIQTGIVALLLIFGGIKLVLGTREAKPVGKKKVDKYRSEENNSTVRMEEIYKSEENDSTMRMEEI